MYLECMKEPQPVSYFVRQSAAHVVVLARSASHCAVADHDPV